MSIAIIYEIRQQLGYYGIPTLIVTGNIGNLFLVFMLVRSLKHNPNSCSLYLLFSSFGNIFVINTALVSTLYGMVQLEPTHSSNVLCKLRWFGGHVLFMLSRCCMVAACIDRWALCSQNVKIRSFCQVHVAPPLFLYYDNSSGRCILTPLYALAYTIFSFLAISIIPLFLMIIFSVLTSHNLHTIRSRVLPQGNTVQNIRIHKRDHDLVKMLVGERTERVLLT
ncbi:hypothetical protein I4U23_026036 [Adineta vaga]|nr:hypothetical protein I4U23_026036 [Adineta vaga]